MVVITVSDSGTGMREDEIEKLMDKSSYFSRRGTDNEKGTGLGFNLCRDFIEMSGGSIKVKSNPGQGSEFTFTLPAGSSGDEDHMES